MRGFRLKQGWLSLRVLFIALFLAVGTTAHALLPVSLTQNSRAIDLLPALDVYLEEGSEIQISTAPDADGVVERIGVRAKLQKERTSWAVFALTNESDVQLDRLLVSSHFRLVGSGIFSPDLGGQRVVAVTASQGGSPEFIKSRDEDIFTLTINPGATVTYVVELSGNTLPQLVLWESDAYRDYKNNFTLFNGIVLGISGVTALFLTIFFLMKGTTLFPTAALFAWSVLLYVSMDFGFWRNVVDVSLGVEPFYRAASESALTVSLGLFLVSYLNMTRWHLRFLSLLLGAGVLSLLLFGLSFLNPPLAATFSRLGLLLTGISGIVLITAYALKKHDRAILLIPVWLVFLCWLGVYAFTLQGFIDNDIIGAALSGGLVLLTLLLGFMVVQHAVSAGLLDAIGLSDIERKALALMGSDSILWDWDVLRDRITSDKLLEQILGLQHGELAGPAVQWLGFVHPTERDNFRTALDSVVERGRGRIEMNFRMRAVDGYYRWLELKARPVIGNDGEVFRCVGTIADVTDQKVTQERLLTDAVIDNLTGLPNRKLFFDRLGTALLTTQRFQDAKPSVFVVDIDRFKTINDTLGFSVGDAILLTLARRLKKLIAEEDTLARMGGDQFGLLITSVQSGEDIVKLAEKIRKVVTLPITFSGREVVLTASIGIAVFDGAYRRQEEIVNDAEIAMYNAKRTGTNKISVFKPTMRTTSFERLSIETDLRRALKNNEIRVVYQPIIRLRDQSVAGYEALMRWAHPRLGILSPDDFLQIAEETGIIVELGTYVLDRAAAELSLWQKTAQTPQPLFVSVNLSHLQIFQNDLIEDIKNVLRRHRLIKGTLRLELTESVMMENPEYSAQLFERLKDMGASVALDDFGTGHSSLAYLQKLKIDTLKIDKTFVRPNRYNTRSVLLRTMITMAHDLGMKVIAEGVETMSDVIELSQLGSDFAQGHVFGEPLTPEAVSDHLSVPKDVATITQAAQQQKLSDAARALREKLQ